MLAAIRDPGCLKIRVGGCKIPPLLSTLAKMAFCQNCGSPVDGKFCAKCGAAVGQDSGPPSGAPTGQPLGSGTSELADNIASALCYIPILGGLGFLLVEPYSRNRAIRFHALQSLSLTAVMVVLDVVIGILWRLLWGVTDILHLGYVALILFLMYKAYVGEKIVLPVIGPIAEKQA